MAASTCMTVFDTEVPVHFGAGSEYGFDYWTFEETYLPINCFTGVIEEVRISGIARYGDIATLDRSGFDNHGTLIAGASIVTDATRGGKVLSLDGTGYMEVPDTDSLELGAKNFQMSAAVNPGDITGTSTIMSKWDTDNQSYRLSLSDGKPELSLTTDGTAVTVSSADALAISTWAELQAIREGDSVKLLVDDVEKATGTFTGSVFDGTAPFRLGATAVEGTENYLTGQLDDVKLLRAKTAQANLSVEEIHYTYNSANQLVREVSSTYTKDYAYDANGNNVSVITTPSDGSAQTTITMQYDSLNRQTSWTDGTNTEITVYFGPEWHRSSTTTNDGQTSTTTSYLYDGDNVLLDYESGNATKLYVTPFLDQNLSMTIIDGETETDYYYTQDGLGSVRTLTDTTGTVQNSYDYYAFGGEVVAATTETIEQRYTYTAREKSTFDSVGAPMYYRWRRYNSGIGRFIHRDPIGYRGGIGLYVYVGNNPSVRVDSFGLDIFDGMPSPGLGYKPGPYDRYPNPYDSDSIINSMEYFADPENQYKPSSGASHESISGAGSPVVWGLGGGYIKELKGQIT